MDEDSSTASNNAQGGNPNDLSTEMSAADEAAFIDRQLGITDSGAPLEGEGDGDANDGTDTESESEGAHEGVAKVGSTVSADDSNGGDSAADSKEVGNANADSKDGEGSDDTSDKREGDETDKSTAQLEDVDTSDLWVEIEGADGKAYKIGLGDSLPEDFSFKNDAQLAEFLEARGEMKDVLERRQAEFDEQQEKADVARSEQEQLANWDAEISDLITAGLIEAPKMKPGEKDWMNDPSVQKIDAVFKFMTTANIKRVEARQPKITSFGTAFTLWSQEQAKRDAEDKQNQDNATAKARGALVGGSSSSSSAGNNENLYVQGSAGSIHDIDLSDL